jgi:hypothetical protein
MTGFAGYLAFKPWVLGSIPRELIPTRDVVAVEHCPAVDSGFIH